MSGMQEPPSFLTPADGRGKRAGVCETQLNGLRNRNRLAIHVWEERKDPHSFPVFSWQALGVTPAEEIPARVASDKSALVSMSLLPSDASHSSLIPYMVMPGRLTKLAYLVDLDQERAHPACVVYAHPGNIASGVSVFDKSFVLHDHTNIEALRELYAPHGNEEAWIRHVAGNRDASAAQLDALGAWYASRKEEKPCKHEVNEMLVAAAHSHIAAIAVPHYAKKYYEWSRDNAKHHETMLTLQGALAGLEHIGRGLDVPLVKYTVEPFSLDKTPAQQGGITYIAQGKKELLDTVVSCVKEMQRDNKALPKELSEHLYVMTGLESAVPLHQQRQVLEQLRRRGETAQAQAPGRNI